MGNDPGTPLRPVVPAVAWQERVKTGKRVAQFGPGAGIREIDASPA
jgi:hypothetical protein